MEKKKLNENAQDILLSFISTLDYTMIYLRTGKPVADAIVMKDRGRCHVLLKPNEMNDNEILENIDLKGL